MLRTPGGLFWVQADTAEDARDCASQPGTSVLFYVRSSGSIQPCRALGPDLLAGLPRGAVVAVIVNRGLVRVSRGGRHVLAHGACGRRGVAIAGARSRDRLFN